MKTMENTEEVSLPPAQLAGWGLKIGGDEAHVTDKSHFGTPKWLANPSAGRIIAETTRKTQFDAMNHKSNGKSRLKGSSAHAFTLVELLAVLAAIFLLSCLFAPALARAKIKSPAAGCLSNQRQLMLGWAMYREENNDYLMPNAPSGALPAASGWINTSSVENGGNNAQGNTNVQLLLQGTMAPYVSTDISIFRCPGDLVPAANGFRLRSYSMNGQMGAEYDASFNFDAPALLFLKGSDISCPSPSSAFVFCDEHPGTINDGYLQIDSNGTSGFFPDIPASYLDGGCGFGFADGHGEIHHWVTSNLLIPVIYGVGYPSVQVTGMNRLNADWLWFSQRSACTHR